MWCPSLPKCLPFLLPDVYRKSMVYLCTSYILVPTGVLFDVLNACTRRWSAL